MMKKFTLMLMVMMVIATLFGCAEVVAPDYTDTELETALNNGEVVNDKTVSIEVINIEPDSAFGYNLQVGEHMNFISLENPEVEVGDILTVKIVKAGNVFGSWIITYEK